MSARTCLSTILFIAVSALAGCAAEAPSGGGGGGTGDDGGGGGGGGGGGSATASQVLAKFGTVECDQAHACKATFPTDAGVTFAEVFGATAQACYTEAAEYYNATAVEAAITAGKITFDAASAATCVSGLSAIAAPQCATFWDQGPAFPSACQTVFTGKVADGAACATDFECSSTESICLETNKCGPAPAGARSATEDGVAAHPKLLLNASGAAD